MTTEPSHPGPATAPQAERGFPPSSFPVLTEHPSARRGGCVIAIIRRSPREAGTHGRTPSPARDVTGPAGGAHALSVPAAFGPGGLGPSAVRVREVPAGASAHGNRQHRRSSPAPRVLRGTWSLPASSRSATGRTRPSPGARACHCSVEPDTSSVPEKGWAGALVPGCHCRQPV